MYCSGGNQIRTCNVPSEWRIWIGRRYHVSPVHAAGRFIISVLSVSASAACRLEIKCDFTHLSTTARRSGKLLQNVPNIQFIFEASLLFYRCQSPLGRRQAQHTFGPHLLQSEKYNKSVSDPSPETHRNAYFFTQHIPGRSCSETLSTVF